MKNELLQFENYLLEQGGADSYIRQQLSDVVYFDNWCQAQGIEDKAFLQLNAIKEYVQFMQNIPVAIGTQNNRLISMTKYYDFLKLEGVIEKNPIRNFRIRKQKKTVVRNPFSEEELLNLYNDYNNFRAGKPILPNILNRKETDLRMKLVVSLVIFQGLHTGELDKLTVQDINLSNSTVYVPATGKCKSRVVPLNQTQIIPFYEYLSSIPAEQEKLFANQVQKGIYYTLEELRGLCPKLSNLRQIRSSVLMNWIKLYGKRKAQYLIGHRYVSSTEIYEVQDTQELSELMEKTHLFG